jgi:sensor histidine kinase regulating citrate/malate metabolism
MESLTQLVDLKDDLADQLDKVNNYIEELQHEKGQMRNELETAGDYLLEQEEKTS